MALTLGEFERAVLLAIVRLGDNAYGVSITAELEKRLKRTVTSGAVYSTLERLETKSFISSELGQPTAVRGGRAKRFYEVENAGLAALRETRRHSDAIWSLTPIPVRRSR